MVRACYTYPRSCLLAALTGLSTAAAVAILPGDALNNWLWCSQTQDAGADEC